MRTTTRRRPEPRPGRRAFARSARLVWGVSLGAALLVAATGVIVVRLDLGNQSCLSGDTEPDVALTGLQRDEYDKTGLPAGTVVDARAARWVGREPYAIVMGGGVGLCLSSGTVRGRWPPRTSWQVMHGTGAVVVGAPDATVEDLRVDGYGDSLRLVEGAHDFVVRRVHLSDSRDDCIENDWLSSGVVEDSLLDGCYNAFSARTYDSQDGVDDGSDGIWTISDSLVRLQPMQRPYKDQGLIPGTAGFFKWDPRAPRLSLHDNVFRADQPASTVGLGIPEDKLADCSGNVMVWLGRGDYPEKLPSCFTVTKDVRVWDDAVARWLRRHRR
ncbi:MAG TPA: hypothetical protein VFG63_06260 [Nocardioidaceae bacterium]|nr:hypothetical protein [Nocardioidaceae bacterium]